MSELESDSANDSKGVYLRPIRTYAVRMGRMTDSERRNYENFHHVWCLPFEHRTLNFVDLFLNDNPTVMEIGFGMGQATAQIAEEHPNINYIGCEVHVPGIGRLLGAIKQKQLKNIYIVDHDALEVLEAMIPVDSLSGYNIFFPDPWPKKRHHKRRLIMRPRTDLMVSRLAPEGYIYFVTDWEEYAEAALNELSATPGIHNKYESFALRQEWRPTTKFERKALDAGRKIYELLFVKDTEKTED